MNIEGHEALPSIRDLTTSLFKKSVLDSLYSGKNPKEKSESHYVSIKNRYPRHVALLEDFETVGWVPVPAYRERYGDSIPENSFLLANYDGPVMLKVLDNSEKETFEDILSAEDWSDPAARGGLDDGWDNRYVKRVFKDFDLIEDGAHLLEDRRHWRDPI